LGLAWAGVQLLVAAAPEGLPRVQEIRMDGVVLLFTLAVSLLTGLAFGLAPTLRLSSPDLARDLRDGDRGSTGGKAQNRLRSALVVSEVAVALVLLVGAGILIRSFQAIQEVDLAIEPEGVLTYEVNLPDTRYPEGADRIGFYRSLFPRIEALPGVRAVGAVSWLPSQGRYHTWGFRRVGSDSSEEEWTATDVRVVDGRYFQAMGIGLVNGRLPGAQDGPDSDPVVLINEFIANRFFGSDEPVGSMMNVSGQVRRVVGVVENVPHDPFGGMSPKVYILHDQFASNRNWAMIQTVSTEGDPEALIPGIRKSLNAVDPNLVLYRVRTMENILSASISRQRFSLTLMGIFAGMALLLAALGIYGVLSYLVSQRHHEIGIRMALGAPRGSVRRLVIGQGMAMTGIGIAVGLLAAFYLSRWLRALIFEVEVADPWVFGAVTVALVSTAWLAAFLPARRATRVDPASAFRGE
jgi:predicted permease